MIEAVSVGIGAVSGAALMGLWLAFEMVRRAHLERDLGQARQEADTWKMKAAALGDLLAKSEAASIDLGKRLVTAQAAHLTELRSLEIELAACQDPKVVGDRLKRLLGTT